MKKNLLLFLAAGLTFYTVHSQEINDAMRYAQNNQNGTARFRAMGGAFGALGGDLSAINVNPASSAVFSNNQISTTLSNFSTKNNSNYFETNTSKSDNSFDMNQAGGVFVFRNNNLNSKWKKFSISINYENTNNFDNKINSFGTNLKNNISNYFLSYANANPSRNQPGIPLGVITDNNYFQLNYADQQAYLGYYGYLINPLNENDNSNTIYTSNVPAGGNYYQENSIISTGYNGKLSFNSATSYRDKIYIGLTLNSHFTNYKKNSLFYEENDNANTNIVDLVSTSFENEITTDGSGFSFQLGAIAKVTNEVRLGLSYESPTWYTFNDKVRQNLVSRVFNYTNNTSPNLSFENPDSNDVVIYDTYKLRTPGKLTGSLAYVFNKKGLISFDYSFKDYGNTEYSIERDSRNEFVNSDISNQLTGASEFRIGGEYKIKTLSLRAGYRFEQSPYKNARTIGDLNSYSGGLGYNFGTWKLDLAYTYAERNSQQSFFSQGFTDSAKINTVNNNVSMTLAFEL
jgi:hypothetical protein